MNLKFLITLSIVLFGLTIFVVETEAAGMAADMPRAELAKIICEKMHVWNVKCDAARAEEIIQAWEAAKP